MKRSDVDVAAATPSPVTMKRSFSSGTSTGSTSGSHSGTGTSATTNTSRSRSISISRETSSSLTPPPPPPPRSCRSFDDRQCNNSTGNLNHQYDGLPVSGNNRSRSRSNSFDFVPDELLNRGRENQRKNQHKSQQQSHQQQQQLHPSRSCSDIHFGDSFNDSRNSRTPMYRCGGDSDGHLDQRNSKSDRRQEFQRQCTKQHSNSNPNNNTSSAKRGSSSRNSHNNNESNSSNKSWSWWNFMSTSTNRLPPQSSTSRRVNSQTHHHSSPELSLDFYDDDDGSEENDEEQRSRRLHASTNVDDEINRRVANMLGTSAPHSLDYPAYVPPPRTISSSSSSSSTQRRRERRLRERYANNGRSQSHDDISRTNARNINRDERNQPPQQTRQNTYQPSIQCNPVSTMVLQNLPLIKVRYEDLFPEEIGNDRNDIESNISFTAKEYDQINCSSSSISIGIDQLKYSCTICSDDIEVDSMAIRLPCSHLYHNCESCILTWLMKFNTCPICRYTLPTNTDLCRRTNEPNDNTPMKAIHQKHYQSETNDVDQIRPMQYTMQEMEQLSFSYFQQYYKSWVICTYNSRGNHKKLQLELPSSFMKKNSENDRDSTRVDPSVVNYLVEQNVIRLVSTSSPVTIDLNMNNTNHNNTSISSFHSHLKSMSVKDLKSLVPSDIIISNHHIVEKQDLIDLIQRQLAY